MKVSLVLFLTVFYASTSFGLGPGTLPSQACGADQLSEAQNMIQSKSNQIGSLLNVYKTKPLSLEQIKQNWETLLSGGTEWIESEVINPILPADIAAIVGALELQAGGDFALNQQVLNQVLGEKLICGDLRPLRVNIRLTCDLSHYQFDASCTDL